MPVSINHEDFSLTTPYGQVFARCWYPNKQAQAQPLAPIILLHDSLGCVALWRDFPALLASATQRNVVAYDRLGFGRSDPHPGDWSNDFIRQEAQRYVPLVRAGLGIERFIAFGHSVGGAMATHCAALFPEHCLALVTESSQAFVEERTVLGVQRAKEQFEQPGQIERLRKYHGEKAQWVLNAWTQTWLSPTYADWTIEQGLPAIGCPHLVIHGADDEFGSTQHAHRYAGLTGGSSEMLLISDCMHVPHREQPQTVIDAVCRQVSCVS